MDDQVKTTIDDLTDEELVEGFMRTYGISREQAERQAAIARGDVPDGVVAVPGKQ